MQDTCTQFCEVLNIPVAARSSPLSRAQCQEVLEELMRFHPKVNFKTTFLMTYGDNDQKQSLRTLDKTDFFTREIDQLLLQGGCRIAIHSAKDLPYPLPEGLKVIAITQGVDCSDSLVMRPGATLYSLPSGSLIATSSDRRETCVKSLRSDLRFADLRGTIAQRLAKLESGEADGVVVAEAALIRLGLTHLNRLILPGETVPLQGKLAVLARHDDNAMAQLFAAIDSGIR